MRAESDTAVLATVVWATGQLVDTSAVPWLDSLLQSADTPLGVATEAAGAFGKIRTAANRAGSFFSVSSSAAGGDPTATRSIAKLYCGRVYIRAGRYGRDPRPITKS